MGVCGEGLPHSHSLVDPGRSSPAACFTWLEKPPNPRSTLAATAIYLWKREHLPLLEQYAAGGSNMDAPGHYIQWLTKQVDVYGFRIPGRWMDIGTPAQYEEACREYAA